MAWTDRLATNGWAVLLAAGVLAGGLVTGRLAGRAGDARESVAAEARHAQELDAQLRLLIQRLGAKRRIAVALLAGRLTLLEAAGHFRVLNADRSAAGQAGVRCYHPGASEEERLCQEVIAWIDAQLSDPEEDPCQTLAVCARLEHELADHLRRGTLLLPDVSPSPLEASLTHE